MRDVGPLTCYTNYGLQENYDRPESIGRCRARLLLFRR